MLTNEKIIRAVEALREANHRVSQIKITVWYDGSGSVCACSDTGVEIAYECYGSNEKIDNILDKILGKPVQSPAEQWLRNQSNG